MGSSSSSQPEIGSDIMSDFRELRRDHLGVVLQHLQSELTFLLREYTFASETAYEKERCRLEGELGAEA